MDPLPPADFAFAHAGAENEGGELENLGLPKSVTNELSSLSIEEQAMILSECICMYVCICVCIRYV
jgi:hypothetical protein